MKKLLINKNIQLVHFIAVFLCLQSEAICQLEKNITNSYWDKGRIYNYTAIFKDSLGNLITNENINILPTGEIWEIDSKQTLANYEIKFNSSDSSRLASSPLNGVKKAWRKHYQEGVISNDTLIWMHPIRSNQYVLTEVAPFPMVKFPIIENRSWQNTLWIYKVFGTFEGTVECSYKIDKQENRQYPFDTILCWKIDAIAAHDKLGKSQITIYFNERIGFVELHYHFYNGMTMNFTLTDYKIP
jgi:hypothetical protein